MDKSHNWDSMVLDGQGPELKDSDIPVCTNCFAHYDDPEASLPCPNLKDADEIITEIAEVLAEADGDFIKSIANQVLTSPIEYLGDSMFAVKDSK